MNRQDMDVLSCLLQRPFESQRVLSEITEYSLGAVNKSVRKLVTEGYLDEQNNITEKAKEEACKNAPQNAIILAAGFGMRMVPINLETPKALLEVNGETLIERIIKQLHEVGISRITVVVGFLKERFEYLIDEYGIDLIVNEEYATKNNLHSLRLATDSLSNTYIVPSDVWCEKNPFSKYELYSWYMVSDQTDRDSDVRVNRKNELVIVPGNDNGNEMIGISYLAGKQADVVRQRLLELDNNNRYDNAFWEECLYDKDRMILQAKLAHFPGIVEINTYEQLRDLDKNSNQLQSEAMRMITQTLEVDLSDVVNLTVLKKGMTNRSFIFTCKGKRYIMRIPGEGTEQLINRFEEAQVYQALSGRGICDDIVGLSPKQGYKITEYIENSRVCDPENEEDLVACMKKLREFHALSLSVDHEFNIFDQIEFYESLWNGTPSIYRDYQRTKEHVFSLIDYIAQNSDKKRLAHIDAVPDNFLFTESGDIRLIDWEYAGMQDPHVDIAMFCIYALYDRKQVDHLIDLYFEDKCTKQNRLKIYCYIAACGLLWSNWCEYKRSLGVEFGEYSLRQYRYAKDYFKIVSEELKGNESWGR